MEEIFKNRHVNSFCQIKGHNTLIKNTGKSKEGGHKVDSDISRKITSGD